MMGLLLSLLLSLLFIVSSSEVKYLHHGVVRFVILVLVWAKSLPAADEDLLLRLYGTAFALLLGSITSNHDSELQNN